VEPPNSVYRKDIDGLRAIAVLSVIFHHLSPSFLPGGYIGVDIFFVISGFLITSHIVKELGEGVFTLRSFYRRRINRIIPALFVVLLASMVIGVVLLSPADLSMLAKSAFSAMLGVSNIFIWQHYGNYFSGNTQEAPLLHTWSLGVEEQFYIIWPLLVALLLKYGHGKAMAILTTLMLGAVLLSEFGVGYAASASYYLLPTRFFELMAGGLVANVVLKKLAHTLAASRWCYMAGMTLIAGSLIWLNKSSPFPGYNAIWPCLGAALLIFAGSHPGFNSRMLMNPVMVFVGLISYSLYLWHWPIISYLNYLHIEIGMGVGVAIFITSLLMAWLSWKYIEVPMRKSGSLMPFHRVFTRRFVLPTALLATVGWLVISSKGLPDRFDSRVAEMEIALEARPESFRAGCHVPTALYATPLNPVKCRLGEEKTQPDGVLIGDSYANHFTGMLDEMAKAEGLSLVDYTMDGCPPILGYGGRGKGGYAEKCRERNKAAYAEISEKGFGWVVLAGEWSGSVVEGNQLEASIKHLLDADIKVTLILNNQTIPNASTCPVRTLMYGSNSKCVVPRQEKLAYFLEIQSRYPKLSFIDPNKVICDEHVCDPTKGGVLLYRDSGHLNDIGSRLIGLDLLRMGVKLRG